MSRHIAKKVVLSTMRECKQPGCGCFTQKGYYIQYQNGNVDSMLFVCERCYEKNFRSTCSVGDFDESRYIVKSNTPRYQPTNPTLRNLIQWTRKATKTARIASIVIALILGTTVGFKEHPSLRTEFSAPQWHVQLNTDIHFATQNLEGIFSRLETISGQVTRVFIHGGKEND